MSTLVKVPLRSVIPDSGRMTLRHAIPIQVMGQAAPNMAEVTQEETSTPQVVSISESETTVRKGRQAR